MHRRDCRAALKLMEPAEHGEENVSCLSLERCQAVRFVSVIAASRREMHDVGENVTHSLANHVTQIMGAGAISRDMRGIWWSCTRHLERKLVFCWRPSMSCLTMSRGTVHIAMSAAVCIISHLYSHCPATRQAAADPIGGAVCTVQDNVCTVAGCRTVRLRSVVASDVTNL